MKLCCFQVNGWNWTTSSQVKFARFKRPKDTCFLSYVEYRPNVAVLCKTELAKRRSYRRSGE
jgi:hypothetical protein